MPVAPDPSFGWPQAAFAFAVIAAAAFSVTWVVTDLLHVRRTAYIAVLTVVVVSLGAGYLWSSGTALADLVVRHAWWGVLAGVIAGAIVAPGVRRMAPSAREHADTSAGLLVWEGPVYGFAEAVLLATLPVLAVWQGAEDLGWTEGTGAAVASGALAIVGSLFVIAVHHLGYRSFRGAAARPKLMGALVGCGVQALAFLLTGNLLAPVIAHVLLHWQMALRRIELPPETAPVASHARPQPASMPA